MTAASKDHPVLVASDFSEAAGEAIRQAHEHARQTGARLVACHVIPRAIQMHALFAHLNQRDLDDLVGRQHELADKLTDQVCTVTDRDADDFDVVIESGEPYVEIVEQAERLHAGLVVVSNRGASALDRVLLGSVSEKVVRYAHGPVLVARRTETTGNVLVATDLSNPSTPALEIAIAETERRGAKLTVLHVVDIEPMPGAIALAPLGAAPPVPSEETVAQVKEAARSMLEDLLKQKGATGEVRVSSGAPADEVVAAADDVGADLVVVATRGRTGIARLTLGSVAEAVVRKAPCSVLAVRLPHR